MAGQAVPLDERLQLGALRPVTDQREPGLPAETVIALAGDRKGLHQHRQVLHRRQAAHGADHEGPMP